LAPTPEAELAVGVAVGEEDVVVGLVLALCWEQATATKIKEQNKKLKPSMFFTSASKAFGIQRHRIARNAMSAW